MYKEILYSTLIGSRLTYKFIYKIVIRKVFQRFILVKAKYYKLTK